MRLLLALPFICVVFAGCGSGSESTAAQPPALNVYPDRLDAFFDLSNDYDRRLDFRIATDAYGAGEYDIDFVDEHPGPYDDEEEGVLTEYSPDCTPCQWVVPSGSFHVTMSKIDDGDANTWRFSIKGKDIMIAPRATSGSVDLDAAEPLADAVEGRGEANFYVVPPEPFSPTHVDTLTLPPGEATILRATQAEEKAGEGPRVRVTASQAGNVVYDDLDGWDVYMDVPQALISDEGSNAVTSSPDGELRILATFTANAAGWHRQFELSSGMLVVDTAAPAVDDELALQLTDADFVEIGDEYLPPTSLHVTFDTIALSATLMRSRE
jgi:hypothetical protein